MAVVSDFDDDVTAFVPGGKPNGPLVVLADGAASKSAGPEIIIASTTSTILVDDLSGAVAHPERFPGGPPHPPARPEEVWINRPKTRASNYGGVLPRTRGLLPRRIGHRIGDP